MSPHLATLGKQKTRKTNKVTESGRAAEPVAIASLAARPGVDENELNIESSRWRRPVLIGSIIGSEIAVLLGILASLSRGSTDRRQFAWTLGILSVVLLALSRLRRKALPAASEY
ncbi:hypothetical protein SAMN05444166_4793 [Singulisphaera sp. GP187]|uniref:hypothetical protein n=1 Tax=Singulisphaera sp. GP187 TaxID=1882752 RepID=UPI0009284402|nr:hypothetical protein [Singulisphaera sp. GP187]SIO44627.1 hypothetical protein SAMN05444166_4793 [Singulisphaera sp. GP187]